MTCKDYCYWLMGFFELTNSKEGLTKEQVETIKNHLKLVFLYEIDPSYSDNPVVQTIFQNIHDGKDPLAGLKVSAKPEPVRFNTSSSGVQIKC